MTGQNEERVNNALYMTHKLALRLGAKQVVFDAANEPMAPDVPSMLVWAYDLPMAHGTPGKWGNRMQWLWWPLDTDAFAHECHRKD